jgi:hypothetical protein
VQGKPGSADLCTIERSGEADILLRQRADGERQIRLRRECTAFF